MPQSLAQIYLHVVFSTKGRHPWLEDRMIRELTHNHLGSACNTLGCPVLQVGGVADHVHILCRLGRIVSVANLIQELKRDSSQWAKQQGPELSNFYWQAGYGAFSISPAHVGSVRHYIAEQERTSPAGNISGRVSPAAEEVRFGMG